MFPAESPPGRPEPLERLVHRPGGTTLAVRTWRLDGDGPGVLAVADLGSNARRWDGVAADLAERGHPVAAVDPRGHGRSSARSRPAALPAASGPFDIATLTDDLVAVADDLGWSKPFVAVGQEWGANVVLELAARHPSRLLAIVLVDGGAIDLPTRFADWPTCEHSYGPAPVEHLEIVRWLWEHRPSERYPGVAVPALIVTAGDPNARAARFESAQRQEVAAAAAGLPISVTRWLDADPPLAVRLPAQVADLVHRAATGGLFNAAGGADHSAWERRRPAGVAE